MIIDKEDLITQLTDKTGLDQEQIQEQLSQLVQRIQQAAEEGKAFEIEGFGTFELEEGNLQFTPNDTLETEINNKYAGMKPIELIGAFKEPEGDIVPEVDEEEESVEGVWGFDEEELSEEEIPEPEAEAESEKEPAADFDREQPERESTETEPLESDKKTEQEAVEAEIELDQEDEQPEYEEPQAPVTSEEIEAEAESGEQGSEEEFEIFETNQKDAESSAGSKPESAAASGAKKNEKASTASKETEEVDDPIGRFLMVAVIVLALGIGGWLVYDYGVFSGGNGNTGANSMETAQPQVPVQQSGETQKDISQQPETNPENSGDNSEPNGPAQVTNQGEQEKATPPQEQPQSPYGLHGQLNQNIDGGYTIVLHSIRSMSRAENIRSGLKEEGYRTLINEAEVAGTMYYRVGVGQFQTVNAALEAAQKLPAPYKNDHFIKRIQ